MKKVFYRHFSVQLFTARLGRFFGLELESNSICYKYTLYYLFTEKAMSKSANGQGGQQGSDEERRSESPSEPLPLYQQRDNFYS